MQENQLVEDIESCVREGRIPNENSRYLIRVGNEELQYREIILDDPVPTGRQILDAAGAHPVIEHLVFQVLKSGELMELNLDQTVDLRHAGVERFIIFRNDRSFRFELDDRRFEWGARYINGYTLKLLAKVDPDRYAVWQEMRHQPDDKKIENKELVDLSLPGVERFFTGLPKTTEGSGGVLPIRDRRYLTDHAITFEEIVCGVQKGVILRGVSLPKDRFNAEIADFLILLPAAYPDSPPDMFYSVPWLKLKPTNAYPRAADQAVQFNGQNWQRWSRHNDAWRPGVDGIWTMIKRLLLALAEAA